MINKNGVVGLHKWDARVNELQPKGIGKCERDSNIKGSAVGVKQNRWYVAFRHNTFWWLNGPCLAYGPPSSKRSERGAVDEGHFVFYAA